MSLKRLQNYAADPSEPDHVSLSMKHVRQICGVFFIQVTAPMRMLALMFLTAILSGCTPSHLYVGPSDGPVATLQSAAIVYEDRNGERLREAYNPTSIDGKILRANWHSAAVDGQYRLLPGLHKILTRASIRRGGFWNEIAEYFGVLQANLAANKHYIVSGKPRFADNQLDLWIEDCETGEKVSESLTLDLNNSTQRPNVVTYPIYIPIVKTGR